VPSASDVDVLILGAGCAGLSLAMRLAQMGDQCPRTHIVERRSAFDNDRTWCFWGTENAQLRNLASKQWTRMRLRNLEASLELDAARVPYCMIRAIDFYQQALASVAKNPRITLQLGQPVAMLPPAKVEGKWNVQLGSEQIRATTIVDTRPNSESPQPSPTLWQSFLGAEIECAVDAFDPLSMELMNFAPARGARIAFTYVLPIDARRALIEFTVFAPTAYTVSMLQLELAEAIAQHTGNRSVSTLRTEYGLLPMGLPRTITAQSTDFARVGLSAGAARASTGYAFQRIQRWADACAASLSQTGRACEHPPDSFLMATMDQIFLNVIRQDPARAPQLFMALFARAGVERTARFLSDCATPADVAAIVCALPSMPFLAGLRRVVAERCNRVMSPIVQ
jgi:lycopene beta-cyclase